MGFASIVSFLTLGSALSEPQDLACKDVLDGNSDIRNTCVDEDNTECVVDHLYKGKCVECKDDSQCSVSSGGDPSRPFCDLGFTWTCLECGRINGKCPTGTKCDLKTNTCRKLCSRYGDEDNPFHFEPAREGGCLCDAPEYCSGEDCESGSPQICQLGTVCSFHGSCFQCTLDKHCPGENVCDYKTRTCVNQCPDGGAVLQESCTCVVAEAPYRSKRCKRGDICAKNASELLSVSSCHECIEHHHCSQTHSSKSFCAIDTSSEGNKCVECWEDHHCSESKSPNTVCNTVKNECEFPCPYGEPAPSLIGGCWCKAFFSKTEHKQCESGKYCGTDASTGNAVCGDCATDTDCASGQSCDSNLKTCIDTTMTTTTTPKEPISWLTPPPNTRCIPRDVQFWYKNRLVQGCVMEDTYHWCATESAFSWGQELRNGLKTYDVGLVEHIRRFFVNPLVLGSFLPSWETCVDIRNHIPRPDTSGKVIKPLNDPNKYELVEVGGLQVLLIQNPNAKKHVAVMGVRAGSLMEETDDPIGLAHMVEHSLVLKYWLDHRDKGLDWGDSIWDHVYTNNGDFNAVTSFMNTAYVSSIRPAYEELEKSVEIMAQMLLNTTGLHEKETAIDNELVVIESENSRNKSDKSDHVAAVAILSLMGQEYGLSRGKIGNPLEVRKERNSAERLARFLKKNYCPRNMFSVIYSNETVLNMHETARRYFIKSAEPQVIEDPPTQECISREERIEHFEPIMNHGGRGKIIRVIRPKSQWSNIIVIGVPLPFSNVDDANINCLKTLELVITKGLNTILNPRFGHVLSVSPFMLPFPMGSLLFLTLQLAHTVGPVEPEWATSRVFQYFQFLQQVSSHKLQEYLEYLANQALVEFNSRPVLDHDEILKRILFNLIIGDYPLKNILTSMIHAIQPEEIPPDLFSSLTPGNATIALFIDEELGPGETRDNLENPIIKARNITMHVLGDITDIKFRKFLQPQKPLEIEFPPKDVDPQSLVRNEAKIERSRIGKHPEAFRNRRVKIPYEDAHLVRWNSSNPSPGTAFVKVGVYLHEDQVRTANHFLLRLGCSHASTRWRGDRLGSIVVSTVETTAYGWTVEAYGPATGFGGTIKNKIRDLLITSPAKLGSFNLNEILDIRNKYSSSQGELPLSFLASMIHAASTQTGRFNDTELLSEWNNRYTEIEEFGRNIEAYQINVRNHGIGLKVMAAGDIDDSGVISIVKKIEQLGATISRSILANPHLHPKAKKYNQDQHMSLPIQSPYDEFGVFVWHPFRELRAIEELVMIQLLNLLIRVPTYGFLRRENALGYTVAQKASCVGQNFCSIYAGVQGASTSISHMEDKIDVLFRTKYPRFFEKKFDRYKLTLERQYKRELKNYDHPKNAVEELKLLGEYEKRKSPSLMDPKEKLKALKRIDKEGLMDLYREISDSKKQVVRFYPEKHSMIDQHREEYEKDFTIKNDYTLESKIAYSNHDDVFTDYDGLLEAEEVDEEGEGEEVEEVEEGEAEVEGEAEEEEDEEIVEEGEE